MREKTEKVAAKSTEEAEMLKEASVSPDFIPAV